MSDDLQKQLDDLEARFDALNRSRLHLMDRLDEAEDERDRLRERVADLEELARQLKIPKHEADRLLANMEPDDDAS